MSYAGYHSFLLIIFDAPDLLIAIESSDPESVVQASDFIKQGVTKCKVKIVADGRRHLFSSFGRKDVFVGEQMQSWLIANGWEFMSEAPGDYGAGRHIRYRRPIQPTLSSSRLGNSDVGSSSDSEVKWIAELERLSRLRRDGFLSETEFLSAKKKLLGN